MEVCAIRIHDENVSTVFLARMLVGVIYIRVGTNPNKQLLTVLGEHEVARRVAAPR